MTHLSTLQILLQQTGGAVQVPLSTAGRLLGLKAKTAANQACRGEFPIRSYLFGRVRYVAVADIAAHIDAARGIVEAELGAVAPAMPASPPKRRPGRPTKLEIMLRHSTQNRVAA